MLYGFENFAGVQPPYPTMFLAPKPFIFNVGEAWVFPFTNNSFTCIPAFKSVKVGSQVTFETVFV